MTLELYRQSLNGQILGALHESTQTHLRYSDEYRFDLLDSPEREINNQTCQEAFVQTFAQLLRERTNHFPDVLLSDHEAHGEHQRLVAEVITHFSSQVQKQGARLNYASVLAECFALVNDHAVKYIR